MGLNPLLQQQQQPGGIDKLAQNAMFPQSQQEHTQFATPTQMPTSAEVVDSDYDPKTDAYTGMATQPFAAGGITALRFNGEDGSDVPAPPQNPFTTQDGKYGYTTPTYGSEGDVTGQNFTAIGNDYSGLKYLGDTTMGSDDSAQTVHQFMDQQGNQINVDTQGNPISIVPGKDWYAQQYAAHPDAVRSGYRNQQYLAAGPLDKTMQFQGKDIPIDQTSISENLVDPTSQTLLTDKGGNFMPVYREPQGSSGIDQVMGTAVPLALAIGTGVVTGGLGAELLAPELATGLQGLNMAKNAYNVASSGGKNLGADINAFKGISSMAPVSAAQGGLMAGGGISSLGSYSDGGRLLKGPGDGMSDNIPAKIGKHQPARLADGEFVIPADVVSHLGNGSTDAGARVLYKMLDKIRKARTGNPKQGKQINPNKFIPKG